MEASGVEPFGFIFLDEHVPDSSRQTPERFPLIPPNERSLAASWQRRSGRIDAGRTFRPARRGSCSVTCSASPPSSSRRQRSSARSADPRHERAARTPSQPIVPVAIQSRAIASFSSRASARDHPIVHDEEPPVDHFGPTHHGRDQRDADRDHAGEQLHSARITRAASSADGPSLIGHFVFQSSRHWTGRSERRLSRAIDARMEGRRETPRTSGPRRARSRKLNPS